MIRRCTLLPESAHGSWVVATVAVLLGIDRTTSGNLGAARRFCWTRHERQRRRIPAVLRIPRHMAVELSALLRVRHNR